MLQRLLDDKLLQGLMDVGQVDIVLGLPTQNNAATIADAVKTCSATLASLFPRARSVIVTADAGSRDRTPDLLEELSSTATALGDLRNSLRTQHHISTSSVGGLGRTGAIRVVFAAAELLQASAVVVLDPGVTCLTPTWVASLVSSVWKAPFDLALPRYDRHPLDAPLLAQLVRPLLRSTYGRRVHEPLIREFGASRGFVKHCLAQDFWDAGIAADSIEPWLTGSALAGDFRACEVFLGVRTVAPEPSRPALRDVFAQVVGALFGGLDRHAAQWLPRQGSEPVPLLGDVGLRRASAPAHDAARLGQSFPQDVSDIGPVLESFLAVDTMRDLHRVAASAREGIREFPDDLWVSIVYETLAAYHGAAMNRAHLVQALLPLYLGRVSSFVAQHGRAGPDAVDDAVEALSRRFEGTKPYLIERWNHAAQR